MSLAFDCSCSIKLECDLLPSGHGFLPHAVRAGGGHPVQTCPRATRDHPPDLVGETAGEPGREPQLACSLSSPGSAQHVCPASTEVGLHPKQNPQRLFTKPLAVRW